MLDIVLFIAMKTVDRPHKKKNYFTDAPFEPKAPIAASWAALIPFPE